MVMSLFPSPSKSPATGTSPAWPTDWCVTNPVYPVLDRRVYHTPKMVEDGEAGASVSVEVGGNRDVAGLTTPQIRLAAAEVHTGPQDVPPPV